MSLMSNKKLKARSTSKGPALEFKEKSAAHALHQTADSNTAFLARVKFKKNIMPAPPEKVASPDLEKPFSFSKSERSLNLNTFRSQQQINPDYSARRPNYNDITDEKLNDIQT